MQQVKYLILSGVVAMLLLCVSPIVFGQTVYKDKYTVAQDGSGDYKTLQEAINACKVFPDGRITIYLKPGIYREKVELYSA